MRIKVSHAVIGIEILALAVVSYVNAIPGLVIGTFGLGLIVWDMFLRKKPVAVDSPEEKLRRQEEADAKSSVEAGKHIEQG